MNLAQVESKLKKLVKYFNQFEFIRRISSLVLSPLPLPGRNLVRKKASGRSTSEEMRRFSITLAQEAE